MHEFNYCHPNWHPYYKGRGELKSLDQPFLDFFKDRMLPASVWVNIAICRPNRLPAHSPAFEGFSSRPKSTGLATTERNSDTGWRNRSLSD